MGVPWTSKFLIGEQLEPGQAATVEIPSPATEEPLASIRLASPEQCDRAVLAARAAFDGRLWSESPELRSAALHRLADLMEQKSEMLTQAIVHEVGTPITTAGPMQVAMPVQLLRWYADAATIDRTEDLGQSQQPVPSRSVVGYRPVGVVAAITAYNYPLQLAMAKVGAALAAGCTAVLMPSVWTPLTTLLFAELVREAELPAGVLNVIVGDAEIGRYLTSHGGVDKVTFTGSVEVGRQVMRQAATNINDVVLELGGKSPAILLPDADLAAVTPQLHARYLRNAGQGCASPTRLLVPRTRLDEFIDLSREAYLTMAPGDPFDAATHVGPVIRPQHQRRIESYIEGALADGGKVLAGGGRPDFERGWWVNPTLIGGVANDTRVSREEIFGPVAVVLPYEDVEEATRLANDSDFGLHAYIYGQLEDCQKLAARMRAGSVTINGGGGFRPEAPMGGFKKSGIGREFGEHGIREFLEPQHVQWALPRAHDFN